VIRFAACLAAALGLAVAPVAAAAAPELARLINAYRTASPTCDGKRTRPVAGLTPNPALIRADVSSGPPLVQALKAVGYQAASVQAIVLTGPPDAATAMTVLKERYCQALVSPEYSEIGIKQEQRIWQIVLARPLLSAKLGDWRQAGQEVLGLVNDARRTPRACGARRFGSAPPVRWNDRLAAAALAHSREMAQHNFFRHEGRDGSQVASRASRQGYPWRVVGENIAAGPGAPEQAVAGWLASPGHCANIMDPRFTEMGVAYATNPESRMTIYWTQVFATPR
jgi:uncharacterized protein YkwD